jgi:8-oxo-dGTP pyrophosphatase MutT (NUDIX family)
VINKLLSVSKMIMSAITEEYISEQLAEAQSSPTSESYLSAVLSDEPHPAAVLIPIFHVSPEDKQNHIWQVLLTRRTESVEDHQGQVAFPGGRAEPVDTSPESTALREAHEEIGLDPSLVRILGKMNQLRTITNYRVTPVVGVIPWPFTIYLEETEVSRVFTIPLDWLSDPVHHEIRYRTIPEPFSQILHRETYPVIYFEPYQDELLWGVSAEIIMNFIKILGYKDK